MSMRSSSGPRELPRVAQAQAVVAYADAAGRPGNRKGMAALPFCHLRLRTSKPDPRYPTQLERLGDHVRKRRLDLWLRKRPPPGWAPIRRPSTTGKLVDRNQGFVSSPVSWRAAGDDLWEPAPPSSQSSRVLDPILGRPRRG